MVVTLASHARALSPGDGPGSRPSTCWPSPSDRGTAAGVLMPAHFIHARDPEARVVVFPTEPFMAEEAAFMRHVAAAAGYAGAHPEWLLLLGVQAEGPESDHGWIEPGECIGSIGEGPLYRVRTVWEHPSDEIAREPLRARVSVEYLRLRLERHRPDRGRAPMPAAAARPARPPGCVRRHAVSDVGDRTGVSPRAAGRLFRRSARVVALLARGDASARSLVVAPPGARADGEAARVGRVDV